MRRICCAVAGMLGAGDPVAWGAAGAWSVLIDPDNGNGCFMQQTLEDGTLVQFGFAPDAAGGFFAAYNPAWTGIEEGVEGSVLFDFGESRFGGTGVGAVRDGAPGAYVFFNNPAFADAFARRLTVTISGARGDGAEISLSGTSKGLNAVRACQAEQG